MTNTNKLLLSATIIALATAGCRTDVLNNNRIKGTWEVEYYTDYDGSNFVAPNGNYLTDMTMEFDADGDFEIQIIETYLGDVDVYSFPGEWSKNDGDLQLDFESTYQTTVEMQGSSIANYFAENYGQLREVYEIIELTNDDLEMETIINGMLITVRAEKQD